MSKQAEDGQAAAEPTRPVRRSRRGAAKAEAQTEQAQTALLDDDDFVEEEFKPTEADGDMFGGAPAKKAKAFWPSAKRLVGLLRHEWLALTAIFGAVAVSVVLTVIGPKILGRAMDVIFNGVIGAGLPAGGMAASAAPNGRDADRPASNAWRRDSFMVLPPGLAAPDMDASPQKSRQTQA